MGIQVSVFHELSYKSSTKSVLFLTVPGIIERNYIMQISLILKTDISLTSDGKSEKRNPEIPFRIQLLYEVVPILHNIQFPIILIKRRLDFNTTGWLVARLNDVMTAYHLITIKPWFLPLNFDLKNVR